MSFGLLLKTFFSYMTKWLSTFHIWLLYFHTLHFVFCNYYNTTSWLPHHHMMRLDMSLSLMNGTNSDWWHGLSLVVTWLPLVSSFPQEALIVYVLTLQMVFDVMESLGCFDHQGSSVLFVLLILPSFILFDWSSLHALSIRSLEYIFP